MFVFLCCEGKQRPNWSRSGVEWNCMVPSCRGPGWSKDLDSVWLSLLVHQLLQAGSGGLQVLPTCSWLWIPELADSCLHPSLRQLWQVTAEWLLSMVLCCNGISWEGELQICFWGDCFLALDVRDLRDCMSAHQIGEIICLQVALLFTASFLSFFLFTASWLLLFVAGDCALHYLHHCQHWKTRKTSFACSINMLVVVT